MPSRVARCRSPPHQSPCGNADLAPPLQYSVVEHPIQTTPPTAARPRRRIAQHRQQPLRRSPIGSTRLVRMLLTRHPLRARGTLAKRRASASGFARRATGCPAFGSSAFRQSIETECKRWGVARRAHPVWSGRRGRILPLRARRLPVPPYRTTFRWFFAKYCFVSLSDDRDIRIGVRRSKIPTV